MTDMFSICRTSLRMGRAAWHVALPSGAKLVLLCLISHYNDAQGFAFPSLARLARMCGLHKRTVQAHITLLLQRGMLQVGKAPGLRTSVYRIHEAALQAENSADKLPAEVVFSAPIAGNFYAQPAEITTQNGSNGIQQKKTTEALTKPCPAPPPPAPPPKAAPASSSSSLWLQSLPSPQDQAALQAWQQVRRAKGRPALPNALQCQQLLDHAASVGQPLGWVVQVMALNDWASFDPAWLNNQCPSPRLPASAATPPSAPAQQPKPKQPEPPATTPEEVAQAKARMAAILEKWRGPAPTSFEPITPCGVPWADEIIATALRGGPVGYAALQYACAVAKVPMRAVRARCGQR